MAQIGRFNRLPVTRHSEIGLFLDGGTHGEILLPRRYIPKERSPEPGELMDVFIYLDSEDRLIATTQRPKVQVGGFASLRVVEINRIGLFLDWGLPKDLLLPHSEEKRPLQVGDFCVVHVYLDPRSNRITATARLDRYLDREPARYRPGEAVRLLVAEQTNLGFKAIINGAHWGLLHRNEIFRTVQPGMKLDGYIRFIRDDGRIALSLQPLASQAGEQLGERIIAALQKAGGSLPLSDKSSPEVISQHFGISKASFKKAIGGLYKQGLIRIGEHHIELG